MMSRANSRKRVLSGMRSTGKLHLGNYVGALDNWVRMFEQVGHHVEKIKRVRYGSLELDVPPGRYRQLKPPEIAKLLASAR